MDFRAEVAAEGYDEGYEAGKQDEHDRMVKSMKKFVKRLGITNQNILIEFMEKEGLINVK